MLSWIKNKRLISRLLIVKLILAFSVLTFIPLEVDAAGRVRVRGYYRKDGTYIRPHYRSAPDGNPYNNYSFPGNYNPNTGRITPGNPQTYLDRYYNSSSTSTSSIDFDKWLKDLEKRTHATGDVNVRGYFRKDGTYVVPHIRTAPDGDPTNNYSFPGNYNPNIGKITHGNPSKHFGAVGSGSFTVGSTKGEVAAIQGTPDSFTDTEFKYGFSTVYFQNGRVTRWDNWSLSPLRAKLQGTPTNKTHFTIGSTKGEVVAIQGTPDSFTDTEFEYGSTTVYFTNGRVTRWGNRSLFSLDLSPLKAKYPSTYTNKTHFTIGSTKGEVAAIQGTPDSFTDTEFEYGLSSVYFRNGRVMGWNLYSSNPLKAKYPSTYTNKTHFTIGSTKGEVAAIQGTPDSFTDTEFSYGHSTVYFTNGRVTRWGNRSLFSLDSTPLKAKYPSTYTSKTYFTVGSTKGEVAAIQGTPDSFTDTEFEYGLSSVYFRNGRVMGWNLYSSNPLKAKYPSTYTNKAHFTIGSTKGEVAAIQGTPDSFTDTEFSYGHSTVYFQNGRVTRWYNSSLNPLKYR